MSANSQPLVGQNRSATPFGVVALIAGVIALAAVGVALGQGIHAAPAAGAVPADVQAALIAQRAGEKAPLFSVRDPRLVQHQGELGDRGATYVTPNGTFIQHQGELKDRFGATFPTASLGPKTGAQKGLVNRYSGKVIDDLSAPTGTLNGKATDDVVIPVNRWTILASHPYSSQLLTPAAGTDMSSAAYAAMRQTPAVVAPVFDAMNFYVAPKTALPPTVFDPSTFYLAPKAILPAAGTDMSSAAYAAMHQAPAAVAPVDAMAYWNSINLSKGAAAGTDMSAAAYEALRQITSASPAYATGGLGIIRR